MAIANSIILVVSVLVSYIAGVLIFTRKSDKYPLFPLFLLVIFILSVGTGYVAIVTDPSTDDPAVIVTDNPLTTTNEPTPLPEGSVLIDGDVYVPFIRSSDCE